MSVSEKEDKTIASEGIPLYLLDKVGTGIAKVIKKEPKQEPKKAEVFIKETKTILKKSQEQKVEEKPKVVIADGDVTDFILPPKILELDDMVKIEDHLGNVYYTFFLNVFPDSGSLIGDLHEYLTSKGYLFQLFNFIYPLDQTGVINDLKRKDKSYKQAIYERNKKDADTLDLNADYIELVGLREAVKMGHLRLMDVAIITQFFIKEEDIKEYTKNNIIQDLKALDLGINNLRFLQKSFYENIHSDRFKWEMYRKQMITAFQVDNNNFAEYNIFGRTGYERSNGIYIGNDYESGNMVFRDIWGGSNFNFISVGKSGSGKSYATKTLLTREYSLDTMIYIIDPENEFTELTQAIGGEIIDTRKEENKINPFDFTYIHNIDIADFKKMNKEELADRVEEMKQEFLFLVQGVENLIKLIIKKEGGSDKNNYVINHSILEYYKDLNVNIDNPATYLSLKKNIGNIKGYYDKVVSMEAKMNEQDRVVSNFLRKYAVGSGKELFAMGKSNLSMNSKWTCFKFKDMADEIKDIMIFLVARFLVSAMMDPRVRSIKKRLVIDEAHLFFNDIEIADYFLQILKRGRKYRFGLGLITQTIDDFFKEFKSDKITKMIGNDIINNVSFTLLLGQKGGTIENLRKTLSLGDNEISYIKSISGGTNKGVGLLITEDKALINITKIKIEAEDFLRKIIG